MYECGTRRVAKKRRSPKAAPFTKHKQLLLLVAALSWCRFAFNLSLRLGLFHGFLGFGGFLGTGFGAFFFLLVEDLLAAQQLEEGLVGAVALVPVGADDARVAPLAVAETRSDGVEELHHGLIGHEISRGQTTGGEVAALAQRDHLLDEGL